MFTDLLAWIDSEQDIPSFKNQIISPSELVEEERLITETNRRLVAEIRWLKLSPNNSQSETLPLVSQQLEQFKRLMDFIEFCKKTLVQDNSDTLFLLTLKFLLFTSQELFPYHSKITYLFSELIEEDREKTLLFYEKNQSLFKNCTTIISLAEKAQSEIKIAESILQVKTHLKLLKEELVDQRKPLGLIALFRSAIDDTEKFAAQLLWLLERNIQSQTLIDSHLLHSFLSYHLFNLNAEDSPVRQLYALLGHFPIARELIKKAKKVSCEERSFECLALDGNILASNQLLTAKHIPDSLIFTATEKNFDALYNLFGETFLIAALTWCSSARNKTWPTLLAKSLNQPMVAEKHLPFIMNVIGRENRTQELQLLAELVNDSTTEQLVAMKAGAILYLLPYKPSVLGKINEISIANYLREMGSSSVSSFDYMSQLLALYKTMRSFKHPSLVLVFTAMIEQLYILPQLADDDEFVKQLKKFPNWETHLKRQSAALELQMEECICANSLQDTFSIENYQSIEDCWFEISPKMRLLKILQPEISFKFPDKYTLYTHLAKINYLANPLEFNVDQFIQALDLADLSKLDEISQYERILIEILAVIDAPTIREQIIDKLTTPPLESIDWLVKEYGGNSIFIKAAQQGNAGLLSLLKVESRPNKQSINLAIMAAIEANHGHIVDFLYESFAEFCEEKTLTNIVRFAAQQDQLTLISTICEQPNPPSAKILSEALEEAVRAGSLNSVQYFCQIPAKISTQRGFAALIEKLFKIAVDLEHLDLAAYFCSLPKPPNPTLINKTFELGALNDRLSLVHCLCSLPNQAPDEIVVKKIFPKVAALGFLEIVQYLTKSSTYLLNKVDLKSALEAAVINGHLSIVDYFCTQLNPPLEQRTLAKSLELAVKKGKWELVDYFDSLTSTPHQAIYLAIDKSLLSAVKSKQFPALTHLLHLNTLKPGKLAINQAREEAIKIGALTMVSYLCRAPYSLSQTELENSLLFAVKNKQGEIVCFLGELPGVKPRAKILRVALNKAISSQQDETIEYLRQLLEEAKGAEKNSFAEKLDTLGLFAYKQKKSSTKEITCLTNATVAI